mmetsp:Transcript_68766/g.136267  ORF Transcript_68766/g.136267 Transcript_68766/m.136267 type:complete len:221 (+) Transcript_68766:643-1305(+)
MAWPAASCPVSASRPAQMRDSWRPLLRAVAARYPSTISPERSAFIASSKHEGSPRSTLSTWAAFAAASARSPSSILSAPELVANESFAPTRDCGISLGIVCSCASGGNGRDGGVGSCEDEDDDSVSGGAGVTAGTVGWDNPVCRSCAAGSSSAWLGVSEAHRDPTGSVEAVTWIGRSTEADRGTGIRETRGAWPLPLPSAWLSVDRGVSHGLTPSHELRY